MVREPTMAQCLMKACDKYLTTLRLKAFQRAAGHQCQPGQDATSIPAWNILELADYSAAVFVFG